jgi:hypothetical protein
MSLQSTINDKDKTPVEVAEPDSTSRARWPLLAAVAFLILIEIGGTVLLCYRCEHLTPIRMLQDH